jgi:hypothetical protein
VLRSILVRLFPVPAKHLVGCFDEPIGLGHAVSKFLLARFYLGSVPLSPRGTVLRARAQFLVRFVSKHFFHGAKRFAKGAAVFAYNRFRIGFWEA